MKVALKFVAVMVLILLLIRIVEGMLTVHRETDRLDADVHRDAELMGRVLKVLVRDVWLTQGQAKAMELIDSINVSNHPVQISWVALAGEDGLASRLGSESLAQLQSGEATGYRKLEAPGGMVQYHFFPVEVPGADGAVEISQALAERSRYIEHTVIRELIAGSTVLLAGSTATILLGLVVIGRPLSRLRTRIAQIGEGELDDHFQLGGHDELSALADGLNDMCRKLAGAYAREREATEKQIAALEQMRHAERLAMIGRLASGIAHELGTPLNVICGRAAMIQRDARSNGTEDVCKNAETIKTQGDRMIAIIEHLLGFARPKKLLRISAAMPDVVQQSVELVSCLGHRGNIQVRTKGDTAALRAGMDPQKMQQVLSNLLENALQATPGGDVTISVSSVPAHPFGNPALPPAPFVKVAVEDTGTGIPPEHQPHVFDPFFTTKDSGEGTGLGLSIAYGIVREHGGWIELESEPGHGSCFTVYIPQGDAG